MAGSLEEPRTFATRGGAPITVRRIRPDDWHGQGVGTLLLELLTLRAREEGLTRFRALMLTTNDDMRDMLHRLGPVETLARDGATLEVEVELPAAGAGDQLRDLLRFCAEQDEPAATLR